MKQKYLLVAGILSIALVFMVIPAGCSLDDDNDDNDGSEGTNEVGGKAWFTQDTKIDYTAAGTYIKYTIKRNWSQGNNYVLDNNGHYTYSPIQTGSYSWNETEKIVTHKIETTVLGGDITSTVLLNKEDYKKGVIAYLDKQWGSGWHNFFEDKAKEDAYINKVIDDEFSAWMADYCLSSDGASLLMQKALPDNVPPDQLSGETYMPANYMDSRYEFASDGTYKFWKNYNQKDTVNETGTFAYDGVNRKVFFKPSAVEGKTLSEYYDSIESVSSGHAYESAAAYKAADANNLFQMRQYDYSPGVVKTINY